MNVNHLGPNRTAGPKAQDPNLLQTTNPFIAQYFSVAPLAKLFPPTFTHLYHASDIVAVGETFNIFIYDAVVVRSRGFDGPYIQVLSRIID